MEKLIAVKILVTYWSQTGNTKKVAETIFRVLPGEKTLKPFDEVDLPDVPDLVFIGFPIMRFGPPPAARKFISTYAGGKKTALFVTHAISGASDDPAQKIMLEKELEKCRSACSKSHLLGLFHCQGELSEATANELMDSGIPMLREFAGMRSQTTGHPDTDDLMQAANFARAIVATVTD